MSSFVSSAKQFFKIEHPASRLSAPETLSVAGKSSSASELARLAEVESNAETLSTLRQSTKSRATSRATSVVSSKASIASTTRISVDEIEALLKAKLKGAGHHELKNAWRNNDGEGKGFVTRDVFRIILSKLLNRDVSARQIELLLQRLHCGHMTQLQFNDIYGYFRKSNDHGLPQWLESEETTTPAIDEQVNCTSSANAWRVLKANWGTLKDLLDVDFVSNWIIKDEFREFCARRFHLHFASMIEFTKLWNRIDLDGFNAVKSDALLKRIAGPHRPFSVAAGETEKPSSAEAKTRRTNLNIEKWLKAKFREGFKEMHQAMATYDTDDTGRINRKDFRHVLGTYGLHLRDDHALNTLLSRCGVLEPGPVAYTKLLERFQDRSDQGMTYEMLKRKDKRIIERSGTPGSTVTTIESKLLSMLQSDYLSLVAAFHKLDRDNRDVVTQSEFRALLESRFGLELTQTEFGRMISRVPLDEAGLVRYPEFLATFDAGRYDNKSLFDAKSEYTSASQFVTAKARSLGKLEEVIRRKLNENTSDFEAKFTEVDQLNQGWLTTESLYQLLLKVNIQPPVTREECRKLWPQFRLNAKNTLDWHEFVRHFLYDQETASFPNAKVAPPRKGDDDFNKRSNRLNGAQYFLKDSIRQMISWKFDEFQEQFLQLDPYRTGFITKEEFAHILKEIEPRLEDTDLEEISVAFDSNHDDRVNYVEFLRPFASRRDKVRQAIEETTLVVKSDSPLAKVSDDAIVAFLNLMNDKDVTAVTAKREFRRCDQKNVGRVTISDFKTICRRFGIAFGAEDVYRLATVLDHECTGYIPYSQLVKDLTVMQKTKK